MKRLSLVFATMVIISGLAAQGVSKITVTPSNPRTFTRFIYNYKSILGDFDIKPDISSFVSTDQTQSFPAFIIIGRDKHHYAIAAADIVAFADGVTVSLKDSSKTTTYADLKVVNISESLNLAAIRMPNDEYANALEIDSVWFNDQDENYTIAARMFLNTIPSDASGDASTLSNLYSRMANIAADGYTYILPNISYKYLYNKSTEQIAEGIEALSDADYKVFKQLNANKDVVAAMRILAGDMAAKNMKKNMVCVNTKVGEKETILEGKENEQITFVREFGAWRIVSDQKFSQATTTTSAQYTTTTATQTKSSNETYVNSSSPIDFNFSGTLINFKVMVPYNFDYTGVSGSVSIGYVMRYVSFEAIFEYNSFGINWGSSMLEYPTYANFFGAGLRIGGMMPLRISDKVSVIPNIKFQWEAPRCFSKYSYWINTFSPMGGVDFAFRIGRNYERLLIGLQYEHKFIPSYSWMYTRNMGYFDFNLGFVF